MPCGGKPGREPPPDRASCDTYRDFDNLNLPPASIELSKRKELSALKKGGNERRDAKQSLKILLLAVFALSYKFRMPTGM
jgi:hypothetical protein